MDLNEFSSGYQMIDLPSGRLAYVDHGSGPPALFVHGVSMNSALWRGVIAELSRRHRCIAIDLPCHGRSPARPDRNCSLGRLAESAAELIDTLDAGPVHIVGNDTGGAVCQVLTAARPDLAATLTLTNCDTVGNIPPAAFERTVELARAGRLAKVATRWVDNLDIARSRSNIGAGYQNPNCLTDEVIHHYLDPVMGTHDRAVEFEYFLATALRDDDLVPAEQTLRSSKVPTLLVWGDDDVFFAPEWADHLAGVLPNARQPIYVHGARLFFVDERPDAFVPHVQQFWATT